jgi:hypothetical protein
MSPEERDAGISLSTYLNYVKSFLVLANKSDLRTTQSQLPSFNKLQRSRSINSDEIRKPLFRGWLTWKAMKRLPICDNPELAATANFWLPVQAYYALHGIGLAATYSLTSEKPTKHEHFLSTFSNQIVHLLPFPLNLRCSGNPVTDRSLKIENVDLAVSNLRALNQLSDPTFYAEELAAKALLTTRKRNFEERCARERAKHRIRRLNSTRKEKIGDSLRPTSVLDLFYRLRIRTNYDDPDMYVYGQETAGDAKERYNDLLNLTEHTISVLQPIIARKIGRDEFEGLKRNFKGSR